MIGRRLIERAEAPSWSVSVRGSRGHGPPGRHFAGRGTTDDRVRDPSTDFDTAGATQLASETPRGGWLERYENLVGARTLRALEALARKLKGHKIVMVNTTKTEGRRRDPPPGGRDPERAGHPDNLGGDGGRREILRRHEEDTTPFHVDTQP
jgi:hypothetical protein